ncbi:hypothetical protein BN159_1897 [Streptomyces davaonensis JCM 4913]|uniref:Integral membrane protein n=1 Tax=Streptomyces davaonensis (strain DSM 101723 / JCM 4913 / KCC S-0913 / 768) TaxID=1214101 RepID=K4QTE8_STRDJ|nr:hypothetical protein [Streptomyces davaonensis]CCK26276.1 hypothetical protein BN159_1897 [Streptomyces davaonensis JCM 4913]
MSATQLAVLARTSDPRTVLRRFLALDAVVTGANALAYLAVSGPLGDLFGVDRALLLELGVFLAVYAGAVGWLASRPEPAVLPVRVVIEANFAWAALSLVALAVWLSPTTTGAVWTVLQALTVAGFAALQHLALKARQGMSD